MRDAYVPLSPDGHAGFDPPVRRSIVRAMLVSVLVGLGTGPLYASTLYVATNGSDSAGNPGTSLGAPLRTISRAVAIVNAGDTIEVRAGTYVENVLVQRSGSVNAWITLRGYNGETPLLRSTVSGPTLYFYNDDCDEDVIGTGSGNTDCHAMYWRVVGLTIQGSPNGSSDGYTVKIDTPKVRLTGNRLCCSVVDVVKLVRTANDVHVLDNEIWQDAGIVAPGTNAQGVDIVGADRVIVARNTLHDIPDIGIYAKGNSRNPLFERNRLVNIGGVDNGNALMLGQSTDAERLVDGNYETYDGIVRNNVVVGATWACLATSSSSNARFYNNSCYDTGRLSQASILLSNESEIGQAGVQLHFVHNSVFGNSARPVFKIGSSAMTNYTTLFATKNIYYVTGGNPQFSASDFFSPVGFAQWQTNFANLTGHADTSVAVDPQYLSTTGATPLATGSGSPAVDAGDNASIWIRSDFRGAPRPLGNAVDIGAYEFGADDRIYCDGLESSGGC